jgi:glycosyltransferase involved in cell wall biosynthesis
MPSITLLTCEYPPHCGGVGDYTAQVAGALAAAGDEVTVFCPPMRATAIEQRGVEVIALADTYGPDSREAIEASLRGRSTTIVVQYVPTAFGLRGANLPLCRWLLHRAQHHHDTIQVMFHEPYFKFVWSPVRQNALAVAQRMMARTLLQAASHAYISTDAWRPCLAPLAPRTNYPFTTLPIPSSIPRSTDRADVIAARRASFVGSSSRKLVGHFGTYGSHITPLLKPALVTLLSEDPNVEAVCLGGGSDDFVRSILASAPALKGRLGATGRASASEIATTLSACDLLVQPYPDGVTTRRTSVMAGLINGCPVLTTTGFLTEPVWPDTGAVALEPAGETAALVRSARALLADNDRRSALALRGERTYRERFALTHTIDKLRESVAGALA